MDEPTLKELLDKIQKLTESNVRLRIVAKKALGMAVNVAKSLDVYDKEVEGYAESISKEIDEL